MPEFAKRLDGITGSAIRELFKLTANADIISFGGGNPSVESFDAGMIARYASELLAENGKKILQYGLTEGWTPLREIMAGQMQKKGIPTKIDNVIMLTGAMQGIDLLTRVFINPGDTMLVESPAFLGALQTFKSCQANMIPAEMDGEGMIMADAEEKIKKYKPKLLYTIPTFQNPTGKTLPLERRKKLAELAAKYDVIVIEDDPYCDLRYYGEPLPTIKSFDTAEKVVLLNSFSKTISPGMRVGLAVGNAEILRKMVILKQGTDVHTTLLTQAIVEKYITSGELEKHIVEICNDYRIRLDCMLSNMKKYFPKEVGFTSPQGGLFVWATLPEGIDTTELFKKAVVRKVAFIPGESFFVNPGEGKNTLRLNFSSTTCAEIEKGIENLGGLLQEAVSAK